MTVPEDNHHAKGLVLRMFRDSADQDYMFARQAARFRSVHQFGWSSQQALEKYMKAAILLNDGDVRSSGHNLVSLFDDIRVFADDLIAVLWCPPKIFPTKCATFGADFETYQDIVDRFNDIGDTDHRYRHYTISFGWYDLHKLDELVFQLRRLTQPLDMISFENVGKTNRELLKSSPSYQPSPTLHGLASTSAFGYSTRLDAYRWANYSFFPIDAESEGVISNGYESQGSPLGGATRFETEGEEAIEWLCKRIKIRKADISQLENLLKQNHSFPF